jgi:hypothetical protein
LFFNRRRWWRNPRARGKGIRRFRGDGGEGPAESGSVIPVAVIASVSEAIQSHYDQQFVSGCGSFGRAGAGPFLRWRKQQVGRNIKPGAQPLHHGHAQPILNDLLVGTYRLWPISATPATWPLAPLGRFVVTFQSDLGSPVLSAKIFLFSSTPNHF